MKKFKVVVTRTYVEFASFEVEAENEQRARSKAVHKAGNGFIHQWVSVGNNPHGVHGIECDVCEEVTAKS